MFKDLPEGETHFDPEAELRGQFKAKFGNRISEYSVNIADWWIEKLASQKKEIIEMCENIDFYDWNYDTQRMIKDKIINKLKE